jgi:hypothetical protein
MAATLELKYFNSFWLKKLDKITNVVPTTGVVKTTTIESNVVEINTPNTLIGVGQTVSSPTITLDLPTIIYIDVTNTIITLSSPQSFTVGDIIEFGTITDFTYIPNAYEIDVEKDWYVEEARIRGGYNNTSVDLGVKAYIVEDNSTQQNRFNSMIYSGIFNSRNGVNNTNQFPTGQDISRSVDPSNGSIQKLYAENTNMIVFQESKVSQALIDKDAIYSADGQPITTSGAQVIGQIQAYAGNYGISTNPESFAVYGYRKYFTDRNQNAVLRLSQDGITEISNYGMLDYFRDNLTAVGNNGRLVGMWDMHNKQYVLSLQPVQTEEIFKAGLPVTITLSFDEDSMGWTSRFSYIPELGGSLRNNFYTFKTGNIWEHYSTNVNKGTFYNVTYPSTVTVVFNDSASEVKNFNTINYEGGIGWELVSLKTDTDLSLPVTPFTQVYTLADLENQLFMNNFKRKENKYFATIINNTISNTGDIIYGQSMSGVKGFYAIANLYLNNSIYGTQAINTELFAVSTEYVNSSY